MHNKCDTCYTDYIIQCNEFINVFAKLAPATVYQWVITDRQDRQYAGTFETDANGFWQIPVADLPEGLFTEYSGAFTLHVYDDPYGINCNEPVTFTIAQTYDCIVFNVRGGNRVKDNLGCEF